MKTPMKTQTVAILLAASLGLAACGEWKQDPMASVAPQAQTGQEKPTIPDPQNPETDLVLIEAPLFYSFREGQSGEFAISARVLEENYTHQISIANLKDFPGATFDAKNSKLIWRPAVGTITPKDGLEKIQSMKIIVTAQKAGSTSYQKSRDVDIRVVREPKAPRIVSLSLNATSVREGETLAGSVVFEDMDAAPMATETWPTLQFAGVINAGNISGFVRTDNMNSIGNSQFRSDLTIDLSSAELTSSAGNYAFAVRPVSRYNQVGSPQTAMVQVLTSLSDPVTTWTSTLNAKLGETVTYDFLIMDPKSEAKVTVLFPTNGVGASPVCTTVKAFVMSCRLTWTPSQALLAGKGSFEAQVQLQNTFTNDSEVKKRSLYMQYNLEAPTGTTTTTTTLISRGAR